MSMTPTLDDDVRLDRRAAANIVSTRDASGHFETIEALDSVSYVGQRALGMPTFGRVIFRSIDGHSKTRYYRDGVSLMEHWKGGQRIYNRLIKVKYHDAWTIRTDRAYNEHASAIPFLDDGTALETYSASTPENSRGLRNRRGAATLIGPSFAEVLQAEVQVGRHEAFEGVVIDVHENRQMVAYFDGCERPFYKTGDNWLSTTDCSESSRSVAIAFSGDEITLNVWIDGSRHRIRMDREGDERLELDRTYIEF